MKKIILFYLILSSFLACKDNPKTPESYNSTPPTARELAVVPSELVIDMDSTGHIQIGSKVVTLDDLSKVLTDSLKNFKATYGKMPDTIVLHKKGDILMGTRGMVHDAISEAQEAAKK